MRNIYIYLFILSMVSCSLEEYNPSGSTAEAVYTTQEGFESLVNAAYSYQRWWYGKEEALNMSEMGTDIWTSAAGDAIPDLSNYNNLEGTNNALNLEWKAFYAGVNLCNAGISRIDNVGFTDARKKQLKAELCFLRAFYYWHIVETWGGVHFTLEETKGIVSTANKTSVDEFYSQIITDLEYAVEKDNLAEETTDYGRVTKPAAMAFLARIYLTRGMNKEAKDMALAVIDGGYAELLTEYADLWKMENNHNKEVLYAVNYSKNLTYNDLYDKELFPLGHNRGSNNAHMMFLMKYDNLPGLTRSIPYGRPFNRYMPTRYLLELYSDADSRYEDSFMEIWLANKATSNLAIGDIASIATRNVYQGDRTNKSVYDINDIYNLDGSVKDRLHYPTLTKHMDPTRSSYNEAQSARDAYVIRLAEVYLIAAEAYMNLNNKVEAVKYINKVRERAAKPGRIEEMKVTEDDITLDFILDERARELAGEQLRWFDLKRTGKLIERVKKMNPDAAPYIKPYHMVRPIPQTQIDAVTNRDEFKQNEGYK